MGKDRPIFAEEDVVYRYTDEDALRDGVLVDIGGLVPFPINRATRAVYEAFTRSLGKLPGGLGGSPVIDSTRLSRLGDAIRAKMDAGETRENMVVLEFERRTVWAMPNSTRYSAARPNTEGWTIMFPEDY